MVQAIEVNITFGKKILCDTMYIKLVAPDQLLLSDAVFHSLGIVDYHLDMQAAHRSCTASAFDPSGGNISPLAGTKNTEVGLVLARDSRIRSNKYNAIKALFPVHVKFVQALVIAGMHTVLIRHTCEMLSFPL